jgi:hypothetical protein
MEPQYNYEKKSRTLKLTTKKDKRKRSGQGQKKALLRGCCSFKGALNIFNQKLPINSGYIRHRRRDGVRRHRDDLLSASLF